jgi:Zn-dependent peptidase ImmA (M78 family)
MCVVIFMIQKFAAYIADVLGIEKPRIVLQAEANFPTKTMMARYEPQENTVYLKESLQMPDLCFAVAHELRHIWQRETDKEKYLGDYRIRAKCDVKTYNLQLAELDANAFAACAMMETFGARPLFTGMEEEIVAEIFKYAARPEITKLFQ